MHPLHVRRRSFHRLALLPLSQRFPVSSCVPYRSPSMSPVSDLLLIPPRYHASTCVASTCGPAEGGAVFFTYVYLCLCVCLCSCLFLCVCAHALLSSTRSVGGCCPSRCGVQTKETARGATPHPPFHETQRNAAPLCSTSAAVHEDGSEGRSASLEIAVVGAAVVTAQAPAPLGFSSRTWQCGAAGSGSPLPHSSATMSAHVSPQPRKPLPPHRRDVKSEACCRSSLPGAAATRLRSSTLTLL